MYQLTTLVLKGKTYMKVKCKESDELLSVKGRSRRKPISYLKSGRSRRRWANIISKATNKTFLLTCNVYDKNNINSASVLDQNGHIIGFTEYKDTSLPQFV